MGGGFAGQGGVFQNFRRQGGFWSNPPSCTSLGWNNVAIYYWRATGHYYERAGQPSETSKTTEATKALGRSTPGHLSTWAPEHLSTWQCTTGKTLLDLTANVINSSIFPEAICASVQVWHWFECNEWQTVLSLATNGFKVMAQWLAYSIANRNNINFEEYQTISCRLWSYDSIG